MKSDSASTSSKLIQIINIFNIFWFQHSNTLAMTSLTWAPVLHKILWLEMDDGDVEQVCRMASTHNHKQVLASAFADAL